MSSQNENLKIKKNQISYLTPTVSNRIVQLTGEQLIDE